MLLLGDCLIQMKTLPLYLCEATIEQARQACKDWHYSRCMPSSTVARFAVYEKGNFVGVILFGGGATPNLGKRFGLSHKQILELTRVALTKHTSTVSKMLSVAVKILIKSMPNLRVIFSYADIERGHYGGVYQAANWIYTGLSDKGGALYFLVNGKWIHPRSIFAKHGFAGKKAAELFGYETKPYARKHRYVLPLDKESREQILKIKVKNPKRESSKDSVASPFQGDQGGASPTDSLHLLDQKRLEAAI